MRGSHAFNSGTASPLDGVVRRHGATMVVRDGRCIAAHFGSPTSETAACLSTVGIADRSDRTTLELRGAPAHIDAAIASLASLGAPVSWARTGSRSAIVRCDHVDTAACSAALLGADVAIEISNRFAAIEVIGPRASDLLRAVDIHGRDTDMVVLENHATSYELLVDAGTGSALWSRLLDAGAPLSVACVGLEALEHLVRSMRPQILEMGLADERQLDELDTAVGRQFENPDTLVMPSLNFLAWGRKPAPA